MRLVDHVGLFEVEEVAAAFDDLDRHVRRHRRPAAASATSTPMQPSSAPCRYSVRLAWATLRRRLRSIERRVA